jgi:glycosyltransferase involved in cell wall biosynthesis
LASAYWPNVEGFFDIFPDGLGFLARDEQLWIAGNLGDAIVRDERFHTFLGINESRTCILGYIEESEKAAFLAGATSVIVPVTFGAGAKMKTADAIASGRPVIATPHALEGYGPIVGPALGDGVYVADGPKEFRRLMREAFRTGLPGCSPEIRGRLSLEAMSRTWARHVGELLESRELAPTTVLTV